MHLFIYWFICNVKEKSIFNDFATWQKMYPAKDKATAKNITKRLRMFPKH